MIMLDQTWPQIWPYIKDAMPLIVGVVVAVVSYLLHHRKHQADVESTVVGTSRDIIGIYEGTMNTLTERVTKLEESKDELQTEIRDLRAALKSQEEKHIEAQRRMRLLAKVIVVILNEHNGGDPCVDDFLHGIQISEADRQFLSDIVSEVNHA